MMDRCPQSAFAPVPFPGTPTPSDLLAGMTPPTDGAGRPIDLSDPQSLAALAGHAWFLYWVRQVHGTTVIEVTADLTVGAGLRPAPTEADALITREPGVLLTTRHADCPPVMLWDPIRRAVGLLHSGRRGTLADIAGVTVRRMSERFGSDPEDIQAWIGPGMRSCCYEVREDVLTGVRGDVARRYTALRVRRMYIDVYTAIGDGLRAAGVGRISGEHDAECTRCGPTGWPSYRRDGARRRFAAVAGILP